MMVLMAFLSGVAVTLVVGAFWFIWVFTKDGGIWR